MADKFILKRSSILGKRPTNLNLDPGELGLNTNSDDPGAFFEVSDGNVVKIGPTSVGNTAPVKAPEKGETWFNTGDGTLQIGTLKKARKVWRKIAAPYLGGGGTTVFVAPEFPFSSDSLLNDGQSLPYQTLTRAILELSKIYIERVSSGFSTQTSSNSYTIILASSNLTVNNGPGSSVSEFDVDFSSDPEKEVTISDLTQFNSENGGIIVPIGLTIMGIDLKKSLVSPSYVPTYRLPTFPIDFRGTNQPITSIFKCSGNTYLSNFSVKDKIDSCDVVDVSDRESLALFQSEKPHGFEFNQLVQLTINPGVDQLTGTFTSSSYYVIPLDTFRFFLSAGDQTDTNAEPYVTFSSIPQISSVSGPFASITYTLRSAHRLRVFGNAGLQELTNYFIKVQKAFSSYFGGSLVPGSSLVNAGDYIIVGPTDAQYPDNESSNTTRNSSMYANQVNLRSEYGMCWGDFDGAVVGGFKSVIVNACTAISLQNDPSVYQIYTTFTEDGNPVQKWWNLTEASFLNIPAEDRPSNLTLVPVSDQLSLLNDTPINNIRYYYRNLREGDNSQSIGIVDIENDHRHFGFRVRNGAYGQFQSIYTIGTAIGVWALNGGTCNLTNSTSNFGSLSFRAEGFLGINTTGGANQNAKNFVFEGIHRPLSLSKFQVEDSENRKYLYLGAKVTNVYIDEADSSIQIVELSSNFHPNFILPYSLKPGSALWIDSEDCLFRGYFATDGGPTLILDTENTCNPTKLRLRSYDSTIPNGTDLVSTFGIPYIRRFIDPRRDFERSYSFFLRNTSATAVAPQVGSVMRLNQSVQGGTNSLKPNVQFDPGTSGGWGRIFTVDAVETGTLGAAPQFNYVIGDTNQDLSYYVATTVSDYNRPWRQGADFKSAVGSYTTHMERNWYLAENNLWEYQYYGDVNSFNSDNGPYSLAPSQNYSPFVDTCVLDTQDRVSVTYQGSYGADSYIDEYLPRSTYMRGATCPYPTYATSDCYDGDDGSADLGLCLKDIPDPDISNTFTVGIFSIITPELQPQFKTNTQNAVRYRPAVVEFPVLSSADITNPKQKPTFLEITNQNNPSYPELNGCVEYLRVISVNGPVVRAIRLTVSNSFYPSVLPQLGVAYLWPSGSTVKVCTSNPIPESSLYDPEWSLTKSAVFRFFELMGYSADTITSQMQPKTWGERLFPITALNTISPQDGYAGYTDKWPIEFNQPSTVIANTHTWAYPGYYNYSRGLLKYQTTDITRKLAADFQASALWSGRLTVTGINDKGEIVQFGPQRQALTANYYTFSSPAEKVNTVPVQPNTDNISYPAQVSVYSVDSISSQFDGNVPKSEFLLEKGGISIPVSQLLQDSMMVVLGSVVQKPGTDYTVLGNKIYFSSPIQADIVSDIRIITSADSEKTLTAVPLVLNENVSSPSYIPSSVFTLTPDPSYTGSISNLEINANNTFVIIGGVEQIPLTTNGEPSSPWSYTIDKIGEDTLQIAFSDVLPAGVTVDIRAFCTASYWASQSIYPVSVYSLDPITLQFDGSSTGPFNLTFEGDPVNPLTVTQDNLIVGLGGSIQVPGQSYTIQNGTISFTEAPSPGTTTNLRLITNSEFIGCLVNGKTSNNFMKWGPELVLKISQELGIS